MAIELTSKINEIFGFALNLNSDLYMSPKPKTHSSTQVPNVNPNGSLTVTCDEASNEFSSFGELYNIVPNVSIGSRFSDRPPYPI